jgi:ubiquinone/menaquinone biosynthesis C-methylase UbiE
MITAVATHDDTVRDEFAKQASTFEQATYSFADPRLLRWIRTHVPCEPGALLLDVAGGTGHMARASADDSAVAVVIDLTPEMLATGRSEAEATGLRNVIYLRGDAAAMPFLDASFDLVICRFAVHHFERPQREIGEMARVCRPGGRVAIIDLVAFDEALAAEQDRLERLRDPSHTRALPLDQLLKLLEDADLNLSHKTVHDQPISIDRGLAQARAGPEVEEQVRVALAAELEDGAPTGMRPVVIDGELHQTQRWAIVVGEREE